MSHRVRPSSGRQDPAHVAADTVRICLASESFYPVYAGPAVRFSRYLPGLARRGIQARVFTGTPNATKAAMSGTVGRWDDGPIGEWLPVESVNATPVHRVRLPEDGWIRRGLWFNRRLLDLCGRDDIRPQLIHFLSLPFGATRTLARLRRRGIPSVYTYTMLRGFPRNPLKREILSRAFARRLNGVDCVVASSGMMRDELRRLGVETRIEVIHNGVDLQRYRPAANPAERFGIRRDLGIPDDAIVLLFVGPIEPRKGADLLAEAWARFASRSPRSHLVLVGPRHDISNPDLRTFRLTFEGWLEASGATDRVHLVGLVTNVEDYMRAADIFVFPSRREGMPNVVPEAMASGLALVMTPFHGLSADLGDPSVHFVLARFDARDLAAQISRLVDDDARRLALGNAARRFAGTDMDVERSLDRYADLYRSLARP